MFPSVQSERDDARIGDARRFVSEVERLAVQALGGGRPPRFDRITAPDRTGAAFAVVDAVGRFIDVGVHPHWWDALGPARVAPGLLEALSAARAKAALVPLILRRRDHDPLPIDVVRQHTPGDRLEVARRLLERAEPAPGTVITGSRGLFRLHVRGGRIERAEVIVGLALADTERMVADAREAIGRALAQPRGHALASGHAADDRGTR